MGGYRTLHLVSTVITTIAVIITMVILLNPAKTSQCCCPGCFKGHIFALRSPLTWKFSKIVARRPVAQINESPLHLLGWYSPLRFGRRTRADVVCHHRKSCFAYAVFNVLESQPKPEFLATMVFTEYYVVGFRWDISRVSKDKNVWSVDVTHCAHKLSIENTQSRVLHVIILVKIYTLLSYTK